MLARAFGLTILAEKPTKPGKRNGVLWVPEGEPADLKVRMMGQSGADVALLTAKAKAAVAYNGRPLYLECKNVEAGWEFGKAFWEGKVPAGIAAAYAQAERAARPAYHPLVVMSKNFWPPIAVCGWYQVDLDAGPYAEFGGGDSLLAMLLSRLVLELDGEKILKLGLYRP